VPVFLLGTPAALLVLRATIRPSPHGRGGPLAVAGGGVVWVALLFAYYAGYDLGYRADLVLVGVAAAAAVVALTAPRESLTGPTYQPAGALVAASALLALALAATGQWLTLRPVGGAHEPGDRLRVVSYNVRMGYGGDGRFEAREVARLLARERPDVVLLSEVDRGWLLNGGQDQLLVLARLLDMHAAFGPAADQVWGDAILSGEPLSQVESHAFDSYGAVTGAQALSATTTWRGRELTVISTHLQPGAGGTDDAVGQAGDFADLMSAALDGGEVVVAGGDLNTTPGSEGWGPLEDTGYTDALAGARPLYTARADDPDEEIDHVFVSPGVSAHGARVVRSQLSDHLPVIVDLEIPPAGR
jgi:endonuclease/exonuclease/phosphatase family metal-dependent hydrolase